MSSQSHTDGKMSITRRQALQVALVTGGGILTLSGLAACQTGTENRPARSLSPTPRNKTVLLDQVEFTVYDSFNSFIPNGEQYNAGLGQICKEYLFYYNFVSGETKPWLGTGWEYNAENTELTIKLNPNAHWNDGKPFTSKDVQFTIQMLMDNSALAGGDTYRTFVDSITIPDDQTVIFALKEPNSRFHYNFVCGIVSGQIIVAEHIWSSQDPMQFKNNPPVLTGPYVLDRTIPDQKMYIWKKNPDYWNKAELDPEPEYVVYRTAPTPDSEVEEFKRAQVDVASFDYTHATAVKNGGYENIDVTTRFRDPCPRAIAINCDPSKGLLADPKMHWVISYLLDRETLGKTVWPVPTPPAQYPWADYPSNEKWSNKEIADKYQLVFDPTQAEKLLDELGTEKGSDGKRTFEGEPIRYEVMTSAKVGEPEYINGEKLVEELNKVGIEANIRAYAGAVWNEKYSNGDYDIATWWLCGNVFDPGQLYTFFEKEKSKPVGENASITGNYFRAQYDELSELANQVDSADPNDDANKELYDKTLEAYYKYLPIMPIYQTTYPTVFNTSYWTGWPNDDDLYEVPSNWWGQFLFVIGRVKSTGRE